MSCHSYLFFDSKPTLASCANEHVALWKKEFTELLTKLDIAVAGYNMLGFKANTRFALHFSADDADVIQEAVQTLMQSALGKHLSVTYSLLGLTRPSQYRASGPKEEKPFIDGAKKYLIVYPFTKTIKWHLLPFEERREMMKEHVMTAMKFSESINQLLLYAYGIDDHEFIVSYQTDSLLDFQTLVMELRTTKGRAYTKNDLPIFTATYIPLEKVVDTL
jgi:chlorite dismutase